MDIADFGDKNIWRVGNRRRVYRLRARRQKFGCTIKSNCPLVGPGPAGGVPCLELSRILARIYASFRENHGKLQTDRSTSATRD